MSSSDSDISAQPRNERETHFLSGQESHVVQLYSDDGLLLDVLCRFIGGALAVGDAGVVIATKAHHDGLAARLKARGLDTAKAVRQGRYILVNAEEMLPRIVVNGRVDESRFSEIVGDILIRARNAADGKDSRIVVFGELVALLWAQGKPQDAVSLEQLWNGLARTHSFSLLCAYPIIGFDDDRHIEPFLKMCGQHSGIVPTESYVGLSSMEERLRTIADLQQKTQALENALKVRHSEERFRLLVEAVQDYAIFMLDPLGYIVSWNIGAQRIKGYQGAEIIGKHFSCFYLPEDLQNKKPQLELRLAAKNGRFEDEGWRLRKDGSRFWASVVITAVHDDSGKLVGFAKVTRDFTERMRAQEALRQLSRHVLRTQDEERRRIGQELHDSLGQSLAAVKMSLDSMASTVGPNNEMRQRLAECIHLADNSIKEVRTISYLLYPPMLEEMGLKSAILWYLDGFSARSGIATTFDARTDFDRLDRDVELALFRVLQESLTNIHRHSESRTARIRLYTQENLAILEISDQGRGMASDPLEQSGRGWTGASGVGLRGMNERMLQLAGRLEVTSTQEGTTVRAVVPRRESSSLPAKSA